MFTGMPLIFGLVFFIIGFVLFVAGFYFYKKKQLIEDTPTSKVRSLAMGLVELFGQVIPIQERVFKSPFTEKDCVYYQFTVQEYRQSGKHAHWVTVKKGEKRDLFYLKDDTDMVLVDPTDASIEAAKDYECESGWGKDPPESVLRFLAANNIAFEGFLGANKTMRYQEHVIVPNQNLYIMGTADENPFVNVPGANQGLPRTIIKKGSQEKMFFISDKKERDILRGFNLKIAATIGLGSFFIVIGVVILFLLIGV
jgi:hypothetical protein